ncbi:MAG TPA: hypothetical protein VF526_22795 [Solirubrobacteraceae bacterium]|jgi:hypothetical protein
MSSGTFGGEAVQTDVIEAQMGSRVDEIMSAARKAAAQLQAEVERVSNERAAQIETVAARRAHAVRMEAEADAQRLHGQARATTQQYVAASRRLVDEFAKERMLRIAAIGDRLAVQADALVERLTRSDEVARQLNELRAALAAACERIAVEAVGDPPDLPDPPALPPSEADADADATAQADLAPANPTPKEHNDDA